MKRTPAHPPEVIDFSSNGIRIIALNARFGSLLEVGTGVGVGVSVYVVIGRRVGISQLDAIVRGLQRRLPGFS